MITVNGTDNGFMKNSSSGTLASALKLQGGNDAFADYTVLSDADQILAHAASPAAIGANMTAATVAFRQNVSWNDVADDYTIVLTFKGHTP